MKTMARAFRESHRTTTAWANEMLYTVRTFTWKAKCAVPHLHKPRSVRDASAACA